ncbi:MAG: MBOAT family protein, partial [Myxococcota bacterium]
LVKWLQLTLERDDGGVRYRVWQWTSVFDVRDARAQPRIFDGALAARCVVGFALSSAAVATLRSELGREWGWSLAASTVLVVALADAITHSVRVFYLALGLYVPPIMDNTFYPSSVANFWGRRWNRTVSQWLRRHVFIPIARRRGVGVAMAAAFVVSAAVHFYVAWVPLGVWDGVLMGTFFLVQIPLIAVERAWIPKRFQRAYAILVLLLSAPLFVIPVIAVVRAGLPA